MASDSPDTRGKHRHSPSEDESRYRSKRHKHRHHHRHHHRSQHRQCSEDHGDERRGDVEATNGKANFEEVKEIAHLTQAKADSEMEEGEIVEDEFFSSGVVETRAEKVMSDSESESGEIRAAGAPRRADNSNTKITVCEGISESNDHHSLVNSIGDPIVALKSPVNSGSKEYKVNGDIGCPSNKSDKYYARLHRRLRSPAKENNKHKGFNGPEVEEGDRLDRYRVPHSPSQGRYHDEASGRSRSKSPMSLRRKLDSETVSVENDLRCGYDHYRREKERAKHVSDDERITATNRDDRHHDRDAMRDSHRERRRLIDKGRGSDCDSWDVESGDKYRDRKREKGRRIRDRDHEEAKHHLESDRVQEYSRASEAMQERGHDRKAEKRGRSRDNIHFEEYDEVRHKEKDYRRTKDKGLEREHRRGSSWSSYKDRDMDKERERGKERYRDRSNDACVGLSDNGSDRHRDKVKDVGSDKVGNHYGREDENKYGSRGRSYDSKHRAYESEDYYRDRKRISDSDKDHISTNDTMKESENKTSRDEDAQDDYSENMELELLEQDEDDINRIKEESRKRREAILQKYRSQDAQNDPKSTASGKATKNDVSEDSSEVHVATHVLQEKPYDNGDQAFSVGSSPSHILTSISEKNSGPGALGEGSPKSERSNDMFRDDIFGDSPAEIRKTGKGNDLLVDESGLYDNWDDPEGYYGHRLGEILDGRYEVTAAHGKGVFSTVVRAKDLKAGNSDPEEVAIKIIRNNDTMLKAGMEELVILKKLVGADPDDRRHCVRYISSFKYRNHLCLVFESLHMNLREILKKFGRNIGLKLTAVRAYAKQLFIALKHLKNCGVLHCDIKPDNMLVNEAKNVLKLCDFGNAMFAGKNEVTPYLVSRFYRAPEIILGLTYDHPLDMWSVGCCLYELYTGKVLFPGATNNDMLRLHMELKGLFPKKMLRKGAFIHQHFDHDMNFLAIEEDLVTKKTIRRLIVNIKPKDIGTIIKGSPGEDPKMLTNFKDLLDKMFVLDPDKRLTVSQALNHPFITGTGEIGSRRNILRLKTLTCSSLGHLGECVHFLL